jgi:hypothetical protein
MRQTKNKNDEQGSSNLIKKKCELGWMCCGSYGQLLTERMSVKKCLLISRRNQKQKALVKL